jgi:hypothetical protein
MEYTIVAGPKLQDVIAEVNKRLEDDWNLHGGVSVSVTDNGQTFAQAMTREAKGGTFKQTPFP